MDWVLSGDTSSFFQPSSTGSRILHGLRSCWRCTEHGSGMSNSSLDSASTIKDQSQFQTCWGWKHICQSLAKKTDFFLIKKKCTIHLFLRESYVLYSPLHFCIVWKLSHGVKTGNPLWCLLWAHGVTLSTSAGCSCPVSCRFPVQGLNALLTHTGSKDTSHLEVLLGLF